MVKTKTCTLVAYTQIVRLRYKCPWCKEFVDYKTDDLPPKEECHKCLKKLKFKRVYIPTKIINYAKEGLSGFY